MVIAGNKNQNHNSPHLQFYKELIKLRLSFNCSSSSWNIRILSINSCFCLSLQQGNISSMLPRLRKAFSASRCICSQKRIKLQFLSRANFMIIPFLSSNNRLCSCLLLVIRLSVPFKTEMSKSSSVAPVVCILVCNTVNCNQSKGAHSGRTLLLFAASYLQWQKQKCPE